MRDIIQKVIATETEARQLAQSARTEADRITAEAQKQARELAATAHREAHRQAEELLTAAVQEAEREKSERLARAAGEIETRVCLEETTARQAVAAAVRCLCGFG